MARTLGNGTDTFKHLFERVANPLNCDVELPRPPRTGRSAQVHLGGLVGKRQRRLFDCSAWTVEHAFVHAERRCLAKLSWCSTNQTYVLSNNRSTLPQERR